MAGLTAQGLVIPRLPEVVQDLVTQEQINISPYINTSSDTFLGQDNLITGEALSTLYELVEQMNNNFRLRTANGQFLDNLAALKGTFRLQPTATLGSLAIEGVNDTLVPSNSLVEDPVTKVRFMTLGNQRIFSLDCIAATLQPTTSAINTDFTVTVDGVDYTANSGSGPVDMAVTLASLASAIDAGTTGYTVTSTINTLTIISTTYTTMDVVANGTMTYLRITNKVPVTSLLLGSSTAATSSSSWDIITPVGNWNRAYPLISTFQTGRDLELDEALRVRAQNNVGGLARGTEPAIQNNLLNTPGVSYAVVTSNRTNATVGALPPFSFEAVVQGGEDLDVAATIWETAGDTSGIYGTTTISYTDEFGIARLVKFTRPTNLDIDIEITYSVYSEEALSVDVQDKLALAATNHINTLGLGKDVIPTRIIPSLYSATSGLAIGVVKVREHGGGSFSTASIPVSPALYAKTIVGNISFVVI